MAIKDKEVYLGKTIKQVRGITNVFDKFFEKEKFENVIEIGSGNGVFSIYFAKMCNESGSSFCTYDIKNFKDKETIKMLNELNAKIYIRDADKCKKIEPLVKEDGRCLILNDGAYKVPQIARFGKIMKSGDIIISHDYYKDEDTSRGGTVVPKDFSSTIKEYNLKVIYEDLFDDYLWVCMVKE